MSDNIKLVLKSVYFLKSAAVEKKMFNLINLYAKVNSLPLLTELDFKNAIKTCVSNNFLEFYDFHTKQCGQNALLNQLDCGCGCCGRYYRIKIGALHEFDVLDIMSLGLEV